MLATRMEWGGAIVAAAIFVTSASSLFAQPGLRIADGSVEEGNSGTVQAVLNVTLSTASPDTVRVVFGGSPGNPAATAGSSCSGGADLVSPNGELRFNPGVLSRSIAVTVCGDTADEPDERFRVDLSSSTGAAILDNRGVLIIRDNDNAEPTPLTVSVRDTTVAEGDRGSRDVEVTVTLSRTSTEVVSVNHTVINAGTATVGSCGRGGADFTGRAGTVRFNPGDTLKRFTMTVCGDIAAESDETVLVSLNSPTVASLGDARAVLTIRNDEIAATVTQRPELGVDIVALLTQAPPNLSYGVRARNTGNLAASNVLVRATLPKDVAFVGVEENTLGTCLQNSTASDGSLQVNCTVPSIPPGAGPGVRILGRIVGTIPDGTRVTFAANVDPNDTVPEQNNTNNTAFHITTVSSPSDLRVTGSTDRATLTVLGIEDREFTVIQLRLTVRNAGAGSSAATTLTTSWPANFESANEVCGSGLSLRVTSGGGTFDENFFCNPRPLFCRGSCPVAALAPGQERVVTQTGLIPRFLPRSDFRVRSTVAAVPAESNAGNNSASVSFSAP